MQFAIGVRKAGTNDVTLIPVTFHPMQHKVVAKDDSEESDDDEAASFQAKQLALNETFGTSRSRINNVLRNILEKPVGTLDVHRDTPAEPAAKPAAALNPDDFPTLPRFNPAAAAPADIYPAAALWPEYEGAYLKETATRYLAELKTAPAPELYEILKLTSFGQAYTAQNPSPRTLALTVTQAELLLFYRCLVYLSSSAQYLRSEKDVAMRAQEEGIPTDVLRSMVRRFFDRDPKTEHYSFSAANKNKARNFALVACFHLKDFRLSPTDLNLIKADFKITDVVLKKTLDQLGATAAPGFAKDRAYTLKPPLKFPENTKRKKRKH